MGKLGHRRCEICGLNERHTGQSSLLFSRFPLDISRCKEWLRVTGNEELVYLPLEKLHETRNICGNHFPREDYNRQGNRLKSHAVPSLELISEPLSESQLADFPLVTWTNKEETMELLVSLVPGAPVVPFVGEHYTEILPYKKDTKWYSRGEYFYVATRSRGKSVSMRCASDKCPAHWILRSGQARPIVGEHNHEPTPWVPNRNAMFQALRKRSKEEDIPLSTIYEEEAARYPDAAPHLQYEYVVSSMRKWRLSVKPNLSCTPQPKEAAARKETLRKRNIVLNSRKIESLNDNDNDDMNNATDEETVEDSEASSESETVETLEALVSRAPVVPFVGEHYTEILPYKKDSKWYSRGEYFYVASRSRGESVSMRCASDKCPAHWMLRSGQARPIVGEHNHEPTPWVPNRNALFQALKKRSKEEDIPLSTIYGEEAARYPDAAPHLQYESVVPSMRKWRLNVKRNVPHTPQTKKAKAQKNPQRKRNTILSSVKVDHLKNVANKSNNVTNEEYIEDLLSSSESGNKGDHLNDIENSEIEFITGEERIEDSEPSSESEVLPETEKFSWNKDSEAYIDAEQFSRTTESRIILNRALNLEKVSCEQVHEDFLCNLCEKTITGFRYVCVQCLDFDICSSCEARGSHGLHYMLRVPGSRPLVEVQSILESVRTKLFNTKILSNSSEDIADSIKSEGEEQLEEILDPLERFSESISELPQVTELCESTDTEQEQEDSLYEPLIDIQSSLIDSQKSYTIRKRKLKNQTKQVIEKKPRIVITRLPIKGHSKTVLKKKCSDDNPRNGDPKALSNKKRPNENIRKLGNLRIENENDKVRTDSVNDKAQSIDLESIKNSRSLVNSLIEDQNIHILGETLSNVDISATGQTILIPREYLGLDPSELNKILNSVGEDTSSQQIFVLVDDTVYQKLQGGEETIQLNKR